MNNFDEYHSITGYRPVGKPVPGVGSIRRVFEKDGIIYAVRSNGTNNVMYQLNIDGGWDVAREVITAYMHSGKIVRTLTESETALPHPSGNGWIITHPDIPPMWCHADGGVYRQDLIEPIDIVK